MTDDPTTTPAATADPQVTPDPEPSRRGLSRRVRIVLAAAAAVLLAGGVTAGVLIARDADHRSALGELTSARAAVDHAADDLADAESDRAEAAQRLTDTGAAVDGIVAAATGGVDPAAIAALQDARVAAGVGDPIEDADAEPTPSAGAGDTDGLTPDELRALAEQAEDDAAALDAQTDAIAGDTTALADAADALDAAAADFATAVVAGGAAILADRTDAADDVKAALQANLDALPTTATADLAAAIGAYRSTAEAVVASSNRARVPKGGGAGFVISDPSSITAVVNKQRALPSTYVPDGLVVPAGIPNTNGQPMRQEAATALQAMAAEAATAGIQLRIASGYRSFATQQSVYGRYVANEGVAGADTHSARPGHSEHQTGLVADLDDGTGCSISQCFAGKPGGIWLAANAWRHGYILRYGDGWQPIVGYTFEPWHYRYVGVDVSTDMHDRGILTLEEYFGLPAAPGY